MNIIIVGCGKVGQALAEQLNEEDNNVTVIDVDRKIVESVASRFDVMGVAGNGATHVIQQEAGITRADLLIAVTNSDELNLLCCLIAKKAGNCQTIARVRSPQYNIEAPFLKDELGLAMVINPEYAAAAEIARILRFPSAIKIDTFAKGKLEILKFRLPETSPLVGCAVKDINAKFNSDILVCTIERGDEAYIAHGDFVFEEKDVISIVASPRKANDFFRKIKYKTNSIKDVMIVGGGEIGHYLCEILLRSGSANVKLIEKNPVRCEELADLMNDVTIINGDASDQNILLEAGLENSGAFVALTNLDEENILLSLFAKSVAKLKLITKINRIDFGDVINHLDLDTIIYPKNITSETIIRYVRAMKNTMGSNVETLYNIIKGKVEAAEFIIKEDSPIVNIPLMEMKFKEGVLVAAIMRERKVIIPHGQDTIQVGDAVVIVSNHLALHDITDILK
ncbi:MAG: Trk system potassium transporter TrkA [Oscillospiraceae bacterium]|nr:Trk system potassium transporter TrkA [Oscillospiraceae bacterium]